MKRNVTAIFLWVIGGLYVAPLLLLVVLASFVMPPERYDPVIKAAFRFLFRLLRIPVTVKGREHIDPSGTYLYMANHVSLLDIPLLAGYIPQFVRGIEADRQFRWPLYGHAIRRAGNIPMPRHSIHGSIQAIREAARRLRAGQSLVILPEGHRTLDGRLRPFKRLPFHLAKLGERPIVPVGLSGLFAVKRKGDWRITPGPVKIAFGKPIDAETVQRLSEDELLQLVRQRIEELVEFP